jgi:hypothetical protein
MELSTVMPLMAKQNSSDGSITAITYQYINLFVMTVNDKPL